MGEDWQRMEVKIGKRRRERITITVHTLFVCTAIATHPPSNVVPTRNSVHVKPSIGDKNAADKWSNMLSVQKDRRVGMVPNLSIHVSDPILCRRTGNEA